MLPTVTPSKTATDDKRIKVILGDTLNDDDKKQQTSDSGNNTERKQTVLNIDEYLLSLSTTITPTTGHPGDEFDVGDYTHDEIASDLDDRNNENNTGHFALLPLPPALVKLNDSVARSSDVGDGAIEPVINNTNSIGTVPNTIDGQQQGNENKSNDVPEKADNRFSSYLQFMHKYYKDDDTDDADVTEVSPKKSQSTTNIGAFAAPVTKAKTFQTTPQPTKKLRQDATGAASGVVTTPKSPTTISASPTKSMSTDNSTSAAQLEKDSGEDKEETDKGVSAPGDDNFSPDNTTSSANTDSSTQSGGYNGYPSYGEYMEDYYRKISQQANQNNSNTQEPTTPPTSTVANNEELSVEEQSPLNPYLPTEVPRTTGQPLPGPGEDGAGEEESATEEMDTTSTVQNRPSQSKEESETFQQQQQATTAAPTQTESPTTTPSGSNWFQELEKSTNPIDEDSFDTDNKPEDNDDTNNVGEKVIDEMVLDSTTNTTPSTKAETSEDIPEPSSSPEAGLKEESGAVWGFSSYDEYIRDYMQNLNGFYNGNTSVPPNEGGAANAPGNDSNLPAPFNKPTEVPAEPPSPTTPSPTTEKPSKENSDDTDDKLPKPPSFEGKVMESQQEEPLASPSSSSESSDNTDIDESTSQILDDIRQQQSPIEITTQLPTYPQSTTSGNTRPMRSTPVPTTTPVFTITNKVQDTTTQPVTIFTTRQPTVTRGRGEVTSQPDLLTQTAKTEDTNTPTDRPSVTSPLTTALPKTTRVSPSSPTSTSEPDWMDIEIVPKTDFDDVQEEVPTTTSTIKTTTTTTTIVSQKPTNAPYTATKPSSASSSIVTTGNQPITKPNDVTTRSASTSPTSSKQTTLSGEGIEETITQASIEATTNSDGAATTPSTTKIASIENLTTPSPTESTKSLSYDDQQANSNDGDGSQATSSTEKPEPTSKSSSNTNTSPSPTKPVTTTQQSGSPTTTSAAATEEPANSLAPNEDAVFINDENPSSTTPEPTTTTLAQGNEDLLTTASIEIVQTTPATTASTMPDIPIYIDDNPPEQPTVPLAPVEPQQPPTTEPTPDPNQYETKYYGFSSYKEYLRDFYEKVADQNYPPFQDTLVTFKPPLSPTTMTTVGSTDNEEEGKPAGIAGPTYPGLKAADPGVPLMPTAVEPTPPKTNPQETLISEEVLSTTKTPTTTAWPWNDLDYDYRYLWESYSQVLQKWANKYMAPVEHHNVTVWPNSHPTLSPNRTGIQSDYEVYLGNFEKWEAKNRPYVPTTPPVIGTASSVETTPMPPVPQMVVVNPYQPAPPCSPTQEQEGGCPGQQPPKSDSSSDIGIAAQLPETTPPTMPPNNNPSIYVIPTTSSQGIPL